MSTLPEGFETRSFAAPVPEGALRVLLVEQDSASRGHLRDLLQSTSRAEIVAACDDCLAAGALLHLHAPDLLLLDVELPGSAELMASLRDRQDPPAVVATAFDPFQLRSLRQHAVDSLLKPATADRLERALLLAHVDLLRGRSEHLRRQLHLVEQPKPVQYLDVINVAIDRQVLRVPVADVDWFHSAGNYVRLHMGEAAHAVRLTMKALELSLDPQRFQRIHRGVIVNIDRIASLHSHASGRMRVRLLDGTQLRLGRCYRGELRLLLRNIL
jgi:two-component system LytT family response regulator